MEKFRARNRGMERRGLRVNTEKTEVTISGYLLLYADDSVIQTSDKNPKVISEVLSENLEKCNDWLIDNRLSLLIPL